jgi:hypothetical protein
MVGGLLDVVSTVVREASERHVIGANAAGCSRGSRGYTVARRLQYLSAGASA